MALRNPMIQFVMLAASLGGAGLFLYQSNAKHANRHALLHSHFSTHQASMIKDAKSLIEDVGVDQCVSVEDLPQSLMIPDLCYATTSKGHVNLVDYSSPDTQSGYRVWITSERDGYEDDPTGFSAIARFRYCDDYPVAPNNRP